MFLLLGSGWCGMRGCWSLAVHSGSDSNTSKLHAYNISHERRLRCTTAIHNDRSDTQTNEPHIMLTNPTNRRTSSIEKTTVRSKQDLDHDATQIFALASCYYCPLHSFRYLQYWWLLCPSERGKESICFTIQNYLRSA